MAYGAQLQEQHQRQQKKPTNYFRLFILVFFSAVIVFSIGATCVLTIGGIESHKTEIVAGIIAVARHDGRR